VALSTSKIKINVKRLFERNSIHVQAKKFSALIKKSKGAAEEKYVEQRSTLENVVKKNKSK